MPLSLHLIELQSGHLRGDDLDCAKRIYASVDTGELAGAGYENILRLADLPLPDKYLNMCRLIIQGFVPRTHVAASPLAASSVARVFVGAAHARGRRDPSVLCAYISRAGRGREPLLQGAGLALRWTFSGFM